MITVNASGVLRSLGEVSMNDGGALKKLNTVHANDGGVLRQVFSASKPISDYSVGSVVKIKENGVAVNYIIIHKGLPSSLYDSSCDGVWVLRQQAHSEMAWDGTSKDYSDSYEYSDISKWLNGTFLNSIDEKIRAAIKTVKIPFTNGYGVQSGSSGLSCKAFLLSAREIGFTSYRNSILPIDSTYLPYFSSAASRICYDSGGYAIGWWLRSPNPDSDYSGSVLRMASNAVLGSYAAYLTSGWVRPAFILPSTVKIDKNGYIVV